MLHLLKLVDPPLMCSGRGSFKDTGVFLSVPFHVVEIRPELLYGVNIAVRLLGIFVV